MAKIRAALPMLAPPEADAKVLQITVSLAAEHAAELLGEKLPERALVRLKQTAEERVRRALRQVRSPPKVVLRSPKITHACTRATPGGLSQEHVTELSAGASERARAEPERETRRSDGSKDTAQRNPMHTRSLSS